MRRRDPLPNQPIITGSFSCRRARVAIAAAASLGFALASLFGAPARPSIPEGTFDVAKQGAVGDGAADASAAIRKALDAAAHAGGGTVLIPEGTFLCGPIKLPSNTRLHLAKGATLRMLPYGKYPGSSPYETFISGIKGAHDIAIAGAGTIDGQGATWWAAYKADRAMKRPALLRFDACARVAIEGVTLLNAPNVHLTAGKGSTDTTIAHVTISAPADSPNTDGIDTWSPNVEISDCNISCGDDNVAMNSGSSNIAIHHCTFGAGHGCSIGSFTSGGMTGIAVDSCTFKGTLTGIRIKSNRTRSGVLQNCTYSNLTMTDVPKPIFIACYYPDRTMPADPAGEPAQAVTDTTPHWKDITIKNVTATGATQAGLIYGLPEAPVNNLTLDNVKIAATKGLTLYHVANVVFANGTTITVKDGPDVIAVDAKPITR